jgi:hypothetical protein
VVECLPSKCEALSLISSTIKKKKTNPHTQKILKWDNGNEPPGEREREKERK